MTRYLGVATSDMGGGINTYQSGGSNTQALAYPIDYKPYALVTTSGNTTLTAAQALTPILLCSGGATPTVTFPTATALQNAIVNIFEDATFEVTIINTNSGTMTVAADASGAIFGTATIASNATRSFLVQMAGVNTPSLSYLIVAKG